MLARLQYTMGLVALESHAVVFRHMHLQAGFNLLTYYRIKRKFLMEALFCLVFPPHGKCCESHEICEQLPKYYYNGYLKKALLYFQSWLQTDKTYKLVHYIVNSEQGAVFRLSVEVGLMDMTSSKERYRVPTAAVSCYLGNSAASSELQNDQWRDSGHTMSLMGVSKISGLLKLSNLFLTH